MFSGLSSGGVGVEQKVHRDAEQDWRPTVLQALNAGMTLWVTPCSAVPWEARLVTPPLIPRAHQGGWGVVVVMAAPSSHSKVTKDRVAVRGSWRIFCAQES